MSAYYISRNGGAAEEISEAQIQQEYASGRASASDLICQAGWTEWRTVGEVFSAPAPVTAPPALPPLPPLPPANASGASPVVTTLPEITMAISTRPAAVKMQEKAEQFLTKEEFVVATAAQQLSVMSPDGVVLTNRRLIIVVPQLGGLKFSFVDWIWADVVNVHIQEGVLGTTLTVQSRVREKIGVDRLDKDEARAVYRIAQQMEEVIRVGRHRMEMERLRAGSALLRQ